MRNASSSSLDLNGLLIAHPLSTFYMRVRGHRLRRRGVHDSDLLVVAHGGRPLLRPLEVDGVLWRLAPLGPGEASVPLDREDLLA